MMLELTLLLVLAAGVLFFVLRGPRKRGVAKAEEAARKAVEARLERQDATDRDA